MLFNSSAFDSLLGVNRKHFPPRPICAEIQTGIPLVAREAMLEIHWAAIEQFNIWDLHALNLADDFEPFGVQYDLLTRVLLADYPDVFA
jgi:hypothetical protein